MVYPWRVGNLSTSIRRVRVRAMRCAYCHDVLRQPALAWTCAQCRTLLHGDCSQTVNRCTSVGCTGQPPGAVAATQPPTVEPTAALGLPLGGRVERLVRALGRGDLRRGEDVFDLLAGVLLPGLALALDPLVFRGSWLTGGPALLGSFALPAYALAGLAGASLAGCVLLGARLPGPLRGLLGGALLTGGVLSLAVGLYLLPLSLIGLPLGVGVLGLSPLLAAAVWLRRGLSAVSASAAGPGWRVLAASQGVVVSLCALVGGAQAAPAREAGAATADLAPRAAATSRRQWEQTKPRLKRGKKKGRHAERGRRQGRRRR
jgi:hypothetical protein